MSGALTDLLAFLKHIEPILVDRREFLGRLAPGMQVLGSLAALPGFVSSHYLKGDPCGTGRLQILPTITCAPENHPVAFEINPSPLLVWLWHRPVQRAVLGLPANLGDSDVK